MRYHGTVVRPPSEADSYILQVAYGCSHNRCTFCGTYLDKPFRARRGAEVLEDVSLARTHVPDTCRVFLTDGSDRLGKQHLESHHRPRLDLSEVWEPHWTPRGIGATR